MKTVESILQSISGYLISIKRNTINGWYEMEMGLPIRWVFESNSKIKCDVLTKNSVGVVVKISPQSTDITVDDLIEFVKVIIEINEKIARREKEFTDRMEQMRSMLEDETRKFHEELEELKNTSFKQHDKILANGAQHEAEKKNLDGMEIAESTIPPDNAKIDKQISKSVAEKKSKIT